MTGRPTQLECCNGWQKNSSEGVGKDGNVLIAQHLMMVMTGLSLQVRIGRKANKEYQGISNRESLRNHPAKMKRWMKYSAAASPPGS